jgi:hypothetical protein
MEISPRALKGTSATMAIIVARLKLGVKPPGWSTLRLPQIDLTLLISR